MSIYQGEDFSQKHNIDIPSNVNQFDYQAMIKYESGSNRVFGRGLTILFARNVSDVTYLD
jgi:hypothetical protein